MEMTVIFVVQGQPVSNKKAPISIDFLFLKQAVHASPDAKYRTTMQSRIRHSILFLHNNCSIHPFANAFLLYFPVISVFLFLDLFPFLLKDIKTASVCSAEIHRIKLHLQFHLRSSLNG